MQGDETVAQMRKIENKVESNTSRKLGICKTGGLCKCSPRCGTWRHGQFRHARKVKANAVRVDARSWIHFVLKKRREK